MKKRVLLVAFLLFSATFAFSDTGPLLSIGINGIIPITNQQVNKGNLATHYLYTTALNVELGYAFDTGSDFFQPGISAILRQNFMTLIFPWSFSGELSFRLYNNIDLGLVEFRPYADIGITSFALIKLSIGMSFSIDFFEIDFAYIRQMAQLILADNRLIAHDPIGSNYGYERIRIGLTYKLPF